jgi:antitoxin MazE
MKSNEEKGVIGVTTKVQKWGNSLAVRIPSVIAEKIAICQGSEMEMIVENQAIKLIPKKKKPTLEELLAKITPENRHAEIDFGVEGNELL